MKASQSRQKETNASQTTVSSSPLSEHSEPAGRGGSRDSALRKNKIHHLHRKSSSWRSSCWANQTRLRKTIVMFSLIRRVQIYLKDTKVDGELFGGGERTVGVGKGTRESDMGECVSKAHCMHYVNVYEIMTLYD